MLLRLSSQCLLEQLLLLRESYSYCCTLLLRPIDLFLASSDGQLYGFRLHLVALP